MTLDTLIAPCNGRRMHSAGRAAAATLRTVGRGFLVILLGTFAATWLIFAWTYQYGILIPAIYLGRIFRALLTCGAYAFLLLVPIIGWAVLAAVIARRSPPRRPVRWRPIAHWPRWARVH